jgi:hypothetical protein
MVAQAADTIRQARGPWTDFHSQSQLPQAVCFFLGFQTWMAAVPGFSTLHLAAFSFRHLCGFKRGCLTLYHHYIYRLDSWIVTPQSSKIEVRTRLV